MHLPSLFAFPFFMSGAALASGGDTSLVEVVAAFNAFNIPANASITFDPTVLLEVSFPQASATPINVTVGVQLARNDTAIPPVFGIQANGSILDPGNGPFVVAMVDLDASTPQAPTSAEIRHFLGGNFELSNSSTDSLSLLSNTTPAISEFRQPTPPAGSDPHRYVFLLFSQPEGFNNQTLVNSTTPVNNFNLSAFAETLEMGNPLGGTFILVGPDLNTTASSTA